MQQAINKRAFHSIRRMSMNELPINAMSTSSRPKAARPSSPASNSAADELLSHYQSQWQRLHSRTHSSAQIAEEISKDVLYAKAAIDRQVVALSQFDALLTNVLQAENGIREIENDLSITCKLLARLHELIDERELRSLQVQRDKQQLDAKYQLALYKDKRDAEFEQFKNNTAKNHEFRVKEFETMVANKLKERQEAFDAAFRESIEEYVKTGKVDKPASTSTTSIEDIVVESEEKDKKAFEEFLTAD